MIALRWCFLVETMEGRIKVLQKRRRYICRQGDVVLLFWCPKVLGDSGVHWKTRDDPGCLWKLQQM